jgi:hypothetical protein
LKNPPNIAALIEKRIERRKIVKPDWTTDLRLAHTCD